MNPVGRRFAFFSGALLAFVLSLPFARANETPAPQASPAPEVYRPLMERSQLTNDELRILDQGVISDGQVIGGAAVGAFIGYGLGHVIQGRYSEKGWIFTIGETASIATVFVAVASCADGLDNHYNDCSAEFSFALLGAFSYIGFRIWEVVDLFVGPGQHNRRYYELRNLTEPRRVSFFAVPTPKGGMAGIQYRF